MMNLLVTGGTGYLGSYCAELLCDNSNNVTIMSRSIPSYMKEWSKKFKIIVSDICDVNLINLIDEGKYDCVIHFAAANEKKCRDNPRTAIDINVFGTKNLLDICERKGIGKFIYISTFHVYGKQNNKININEDSIINSTNDYGITHYFAESYCRQYALNLNINCSILRLSNVCSMPLFSEINRWGIVPNNFVLQAIRTGDIIINSSGKQIRNFISVHDVYNAINIVMKKKFNNFDKYNVGSDRNYTINETANIVCEKLKKITNKDVKVIHNNIAKTDDYYSFVYDISKIKNIGYTPQCNLEEEVNNTINSLLGSDFKFQIE